MAKQTVKKRTESTTITKLTVRPKAELVAQRKAQEAKKNQQKQAQAKSQKRAPNGRFA